MKELIHNTKAESPIEVGFVIMLTIMTMVLVTIVMGTFTDKFMAVMEAIRSEMPLNTAWGLAMWDLLPVNYVGWIWAVPAFFCFLIVVWGFKTVVKRSGATTQDVQYVGNNEF